MTQAHNPWLGTPKPSLLAPVPVPTLPPTTGPSAPQRGISAPDVENRLPVYAQSVASPLWWLGTHGGAGETTLASLHPGWSAAGHGWPEVEGEASLNVVLTARSNTRGLRAAQTAATQWASGLVAHVNVLGLVILADSPGRTPKPLRELAHLVAGGVPRTWHIGWVESWRTDPTPGDSAAPADVRRLLDDLTTILNHGTSGAPTRKGKR